MSHRRSATPLASIALALAVAVAGCGIPDFPDPMNVTELRLLAVRAEPPELAPPGDASAPSRAVLTSLVAHPAFAADLGRRATVLHLACTALPGAPGQGPCASLSELSDPVALLGRADLDLACSAPGLGEPGAITVAGLEACGAAGCEAVTVRRDPGDAGSAVTLTAPAYQVPAGASLVGLPAGHPARVNGGEIVDLALALDAAPADLAPTAAVSDGCEALREVARRFGERWRAAPGFAALKRIRLRGPDALSAPNQNPRVTGISLSGVTLPVPGAPPSAVPPSSKQDLLPALPGDPAALAETWTETDSTGAPVRQRTEAWSYAWFTTGGTLRHEYTHAADSPEQLTAPAAGPVLLWLVVRDLRGGLTWSQGALTVAGAVE